MKDATGLTKFVTFERQKIDFKANVRKVTVKNKLIPSNQRQLAYTISCQAMSRPPTKRQRQQRSFCSYNLEGYP